MFGHGEAVFLSIEDAVDNELVSFIHAFEDSKLAGEVEEVVDVLEFGVEYEVVAEFP